MYPWQDEYAGFQRGIDYVPDRKELDWIAENYHLIIVDVAKRPEWNLDLYRDGTHPSVKGNKVLAEILSGVVLDSMAK